MFCGIVEKPDEKNRVLKMRFSILWKIVERCGE